MEVRNKIVDIKEDDIIKGIREVEELSKGVIE